MQRDFPTWRTESGIGTKQPYYFMKGHKLRIYPIPDAADAGDTLLIEAWRLPDECVLTEQDDLEIPDEYHRDLMWWVLYEAFSKRDAETYDPRKAEEYLAKFNQVFGLPVSSLVRIHQLEENRTTSVNAHNYLGGSSDPDWP
jgi:hypothetical protein